jgi:hypothetical protein
MSSLVKTLAAIAITLPLTLHATPASNQAEPSSDAGRLLALQRSGAIASNEEQHLPGKVRSEIYTRYVKSFTQPIPAKFIDEAFPSE